MAMPPEENAIVVQRFWEEVFNQGNLDVADEIIASYHVLHDTSNPDFASGPEGTKQLVAKWRGAFPDVYFAIEDQIVEGETVVHRWTASGTHSGEPVANIEPSGTRVTVTGITISRVSGGQIEETWNVFR